MKGNAKCKDFLANHWFARIPYTCNNVFFDT